MFEQLKSEIEAPIHSWSQCLSAVVVTFLNVVSYFEYV